MAKISVFRIENKFGMGMYQAAGLDLTDAPNFDHSDHLHPLAAHNIQIVLDRSVHIFGFPSVELMRKWVHKREWATFLDKNGFTFCEFHIDEQHVVSDDRQLIFHKEHAEIVSSVFVANAWDEYKENTPSSFEDIQTRRSDEWDSVFNPAAFNSDLQPDPQIFWNLESTALYGNFKSEVLKQRNPENLTAIKYKWDCYSLKEEYPVPIVSEPKTKKKPYFRVKERY